MKRIQILTVLLLVASLFTACKKDDKDTGASYLMIPDYNYTSVINYKLVTTPQNPQALIRWNDGYITTQSLIFNAYHQMGNMRSRERFGAQVLKVDPLLSTSFLGAVPMPAIGCDAASLSLELATIPGSGYAFFLNGTFSNIITEPNMLTARLSMPGIPVQVVIDAPVELNTILLDRVIIDKSGYSAMLQLNLDRLTTGVTINMLNTATRTGGMVLISANSNQHIYDMILDNLQNNLLQLQITAQLTTQPTPPVE